MASGAPRAHGSSCGGVFVRWCAGATRRACAGIGVYWNLLHGKQSGGGDGGDGVRVHMTADIGGL